MSRKLSMMGSSKYEFEGDLDEDIQRTLKEKRLIRKEIREDVFELTKVYGIETARKELLKLLRDWQTGEVTISEHGFIEEEA